MGVVPIDISTKQHVAVHIKTNDLQELEMAVYWFSPAKVDDNVIKHKNISAVPMSLIYFLKTALASFNVRDVNNK